MILVNSGKYIFIEDIFSEFGSYWLLKKFSKEFISDEKYILIASPSFTINVSLELPFKLTLLPAIKLIPFL